MIKKTSILFFLTFFCNYKVLAGDTNINELEKRVIYLEKQIEELLKVAEQKFIDNEIDESYDLFSKLISLFISSNYWLS